LYARLRGEEGNVFFSPVSISTALGMTYAGARGDTAREMARTLRFNLPPDRLHAAFSGVMARLRPPADQPRVQLHVANALWPDRKYAFLPEFFSLVETHYGAATQGVDFAGATEEARQTINAWVAQRTANLITELLKRGDLDGLTVLVLTNAIYFKADWLTQFDPKDTREGDFHVAAGKHVRAPLMSLTSRLPYAELDGAQALELPYVGEKLSMLLLLPRERGGLAALEKTLSLTLIVKIAGELAPRRVQVTLPRFKTRFRTDLAEVLPAMGMPSAFSPRSADFSGLDGSRSLFIGKVIHEACLDVNEEGSEAAAATAVVMTRTAIEPAAEFRADHPFLLLIRERESGAILFLGRLVNPAD
ncbi:MAG TPA: serpin family protein, partial [Phycisphaerae bacterium]|nr:serpin family protein [Phycisphaerae bacterium]